MTFLAPAFLALGLAAAAVAIALHLIARDRPPSAPFPTARFVPARVERAVTRAVRPSDPLLLVLRALALVLAGAAFARPVLEPRRNAVQRVVALDLSRATANPSAARDTAMTLVGTGDVLVLFDSAAAVVGGNARDSLAALPLETRSRSRARGSVSAALIAAQRAAVALRERADSIELLIVSPLALEELDAATLTIRALWPGRIRLVSVAAATDTGEGRAPELRGDAGDPLGAAVALLGEAWRGGRARVIRSRATPADSLHARAGAPLVVWPVDASSLGWPARAAVDTVGAVVADGAVLVAPFERWLAAPHTSDRAMVIARWVDGEAAALEHVLGDGCIREVAIPIDPVGDLALRSGLGGLLIALTAPCGGRRQLDSMDDSLRSALAGEGPLAPSRSIAPERAAVTPLVPWLLGAALLLLLLEPLARRARRHP